METVIVTGAHGLIGSEAARFFGLRGYRVVGIDNDMRSYFFGSDASTLKSKESLSNAGFDYIHYDIDIRDQNSLKDVFLKHGHNTYAVIHTAAQPSHDWAVKEPLTDYSVNSTATLYLLEYFRQYCPHARFVYTSTNKVYGDSPNNIGLTEEQYRYSPINDEYRKFGISESMSVDMCTHSLFGASKLSADIYVQEYGRYFDLDTVCIRGGCLTGPAHSGAQLHGFLSYLVLCAVNNRPYTVFGYKGKQVRDNIHSHDFVSAIWNYCNDPRPGEVYNMGGSIHSNISMLEAIIKIEQISGHKLEYTIDEKNRVGDHIWYVSDVRKFQSHYPNWQYRYNIDDILKEMIEVAENDNC